MPQTPPDPAPTGAPSVGAPPRPHLLAAAVPFVQAAAQLAGVTRIALVGSLATEKVAPKDIDLLVTVAAETDLGALDRRARQMQGRISTTAQGLYGADIFLADPAGHYLGRLCKHRECPARRRCTALHCGRRPYLKDDLAVITLETELVRHPPIILWPAVSARVPVPADVAAIVLAAVRD